MPWQNEPPSEAELPAILAWVVARPRATLWILLLASLVAVAGIVDPRTGAPRLHIDPSTGALLSSDDPELVYYERVRDTFGTEETLIVALTADDVFTPDRLRRLSELSERLAALDFVAGVLSLTNAIEGRNVDGRLEMVPIVVFPIDSARLAGLRQRLLSHPLYGRTLLAPHARATALLVRLDAVSDASFLARGIDGQVGAVVAEQWSKDGEGWWLGGTPVLRAESSRVMTADLVRFAVLGLGVGTLVFFLAFRTLKAVWLPTLAMAAGLLWLLGAMGWMGHAMNLNTTSVPILVIVLAYAYLLHVFSDHREESRLRGPGTPAAEVMRGSLARVWMPVAMTALTTAVGFASLCISPLLAIREFGLFAAIGALCACLASLTIAPAVLALGAAAAPVPAVDDRFVRLADRVGGLVLDHRGVVAVLAVSITAVMAVGMTRILVSMEFIGNFAPESAVRRNFELVNDWFGGASPFYIVVEGDAARSFLEPDNLRALYALGGWLEAQPEIGNVTSLAKLLSMTYPVLRNAGEGQGGLPDPRRVAEQLGQHVDRDAIAPYVEPEFRRTTLLVHSRVGNSADMEALVKRVEQRLGDLPTALEARVTGGTVLIGRAMDAISGSQSRSLGMALGMIYVVMALYLRSPRLGALALLPNLLPIVFCFGLLGWTGVTLNSSTALLACVVLGIAVDDTIHYVAGFRRQLEAGRDPETAAINTLRVLGRPITLTTIVLCAGFAILATSDLRMLAEFGALGTISLLYAWLVDVSLTPVLCLSMARTR